MTRNWKAGIFGILAVAFYVVGAGLSDVSRWPMTIMDTISFLLVANAVREKWLE